MKNRLFALILTGVVFAGLMSAQAPVANTNVSASGPQVLVPTEQETTLLKLKDAELTIAALAGQNLKVRADQQLKEAQDSFNAAQQTLQQTINSIKSAHQWGDDVQYSPLPGTTQEQMQSGKVTMVFVRTPKPPASSAAQPASK